MSAGTSAPVLINTGETVTGTILLNASGAALTTLGNSSSSVELNGQSLLLNGVNLWISIFAPTLGAGFGSTASFVPAFNTTKTFSITASGTGQSTTTVLTGFGTAKTRWVCNAQDESSAITARQTAHSTTGVTFTWSSAPSPNDLINIQCDPL